ncbi:hypothetical protein XENTR_v10004124 [Xenopus tropicalis]|nr:hypothetical protein XENTR_v10004124 [Xenopus tropicalis]
MVSSIFDWYSAILLVISANFSSFFLIFSSISLLWRSSSFCLFAALTLCRCMANCPQQFITIVNITRNMNT